jgi:catechol 2,3-dioxygenase-like lactoylglutathione lyase family enzyme
VALPGFGRDSGTEALEAEMPRLQLSLNVSDLDAAVDFYRRLFGVEPAKLKPGYANFAIDSPPLKLVLNSPGNGPGATINHLGAGVETPGQAGQARQRLENAGLSPVPEDEARCCSARQAKVWARDPDGADWEYYTILAGLDTPS